MSTKKPILYWKNSVNFVIITMSLDKFVKPSLLTLNITPIIRLKSKNVWGIGNLWQSVLSQLDQCAEHTKNFKKVFLVVIGGFSKLVGLNYWKLKPENKCLRPLKLFWKCPDRSRERILLHTFKKSNKKYIITVLSV